MCVVGLQAVVSQQQVEEKKSRGMITELWGKKLLEAGEDDQNWNGVGSERGDGSWRVVVRIIVSELQCLCYDRPWPGGQIWGQDVGRGCGGAMSCWDPWAVTSRERATVGGREFGNECRCDCPVLYSIADGHTCSAYSTHVL